MFLGLQHIKSISKSYLESHLNRKCFLYLFSLGTCLGSGADACWSYSYSTLCGKLQDTLSCDLPKLDSQVGSVTVQKVHPVKRVRSDTLICINNEAFAGWWHGWCPWTFARLILFWS